MERRGTEDDVPSCLLVVDLFGGFDHEDGDALLASFVERRDGFAAALEHARAEGLPVVYANDTHGDWHGDSRRIVEQALAATGGEHLRGLEPGPSDAFVVKPRYSAFDLTPLELILAERGIQRLHLVGMATEMCVTQTAIDARERGFQVTVLCDACATIDPDVERTALDYLRQVTGTRVVGSLAEALVAG